MSRQRSYLSTDFRRLRNDIPIFQASDTEIQSDLNKLKYVKKPDPVPEIVLKQELPKKRKAPVDEEKFVIDGLIKLQSIKPPEAKKKPEPVEKKAEVPQNKPQIPPNWMNIIAIQNHLNMMRNYLMPPFMNMMPSFIYTSNSDRHLKIAKFIQSHKTAKKPC